MDKQKSKQQVDTASEQHAIKVRYKNWRSEVALREITPKRIFWGATEWHKEEQWLLEVFDWGRHEERVYALKDIEQWFV